MTGEGAGVTEHGVLRQALHGGGGGELFRAFVAEVTTGSRPPTQAPHTSVASAASPLPQPR